MLYIQRMVPVSVHKTLWFLLTLFLTLGLGENSAVAAAPDNDDFSAATLINGATGIISGSTVEATAEASEPVHYFPAHHSIWYKWTASSTQPIHFSTYGSSFDTVLAIYTGSVLDTLTKITANDNDPHLSTTSSRVSLTPTSGTTYYIAVDGHSSGNIGDTILSWDPSYDIIISGTVSLPSGTALGDMYIQVSVSNQNEPSYYVSENVVIPNGASSASYTLTVPIITNSQWVVSYGSGCGYVLNGYYNPGGTTWDFGQTTLLGGTSDHSDINLTLLTGNTISGTISLPSGYVAPSDGIFININASSQNHPYNPVLCMFYLEEGTSSATYTIAVAPDPDAQLRVRYSYFERYPSNRLISEGYYNSTATTGDSATATLLNGANSHNGINMKLLTTEGLTKLFPWNLFLPAIIKGNEKQ